MNRIQRLLLTKKRHKLLAAIAVICEVHTADDIQTGFKIMMGATPEVWGPPNHVYVDAWETLREEIGMPI